MRNWASERPVVKGLRKYGNQTVAGALNPYNELLQAISSAAYNLQHQDRKSLQRLAWFLGMNGETHACEAIMEHAKEPEPYSGYGGYGMYGVQPCD